MEEIYLRTTAKALDYAAHHVSDGLRLTTLVRGGYLDPREPSFQTAVDNLMALPSDHPLRREYDFTRFQAGLNERRRFRVVSSEEWRPYYSTHMDRPVGEVCAFLRPI